MRSRIKNILAHYPHVVFGVSISLILGIFWTILLMDGSPIVASILLVIATGILGTGAGHIVSTSFRK